MGIDRGLRIKVGLRDILEQVLFFNCQKAKIQHFLFSFKTYNNWKP